VQRERCPGDGRGYNAELTGAGLKRLRAAWPTHLASVRRHVIDHLNDLDQPTVTAAFAALRLRHRIRRGTAPRG
jgi:DNA-binding MarR family transcriptional regulator